MVSESNHGCHAARRRSEGTRGSECGRICSDHRETLWPHHKEGPFKVNRDSSIEMANTIRVISKPNRLLLDRPKKSGRHWRAGSAACSDSRGTRFAPCQWCRAGAPQTPLDFEGNAFMCPALRWNRYTVGRTTAVRPMSKFRRVGA